MFPKAETRPARNSGLPELESPAKLQAASVGFKQN